MGTGRRPPPAPSLRTARGVFEPPGPACVRERDAGSVEIQALRGSVWSEAPQETTQLWHTKNMPSLLDPASSPSHVFTGQMHPRPEKPRILPPIILRWGLADGPISRRGPDRITVTVTRAGSKPVFGRPTSELRLQDTARSSRGPPLSVSGVDVSFHVPRCPHPNFTPFDPSREIRPPLRPQLRTTRPPPRNTR